MTPVLRKLLELEGLVPAVDGNEPAPGTAVSNGPVKLTTIMANPDPVPAQPAPVVPAPVQKPTIDLNDVTDEDKARKAALAGGMKPEVYDAMVAREQDSRARTQVAQVMADQAKAREAEAQKKIDDAAAEAEVGADITPALKQAARDRAWAQLVRAGDKLSATLSNRPIDETRYKSMVEEGDRGVEAAKEKANRDLKLKAIKATLAEKRKKDDKENALKDPKSIESQQARDSLLLALGDNITPDQQKAIKGMSANQVEEFRKTTTGYAPVIAAGLDAEKKKRDMDPNSPAATTARQRLTGLGDLAKWAPKQDYSKMTASDMASIIADAQKLRDAEKERGWNSFQKNQDRAFQKSMEEMKRGTEEGAKVGAAMSNVAMGEYLIEKAKKLVNNENVPEGGLISQTVNQIADKNEYLQTMLNQTRSDEEKELLRTLAAINEATAKASGGVITDSDRQSAKLLNGLPPGAPKEDILKALNAAEEKFNVTKKSIKDQYPAGWQLYQQRVQGSEPVEATKPSAADIIKKNRGQNSPPEKPATPTTGTIIMIAPNGQKFQIPADKKDDFMKRNPGSRVQ